MEKNNLNDGDIVNIIAIIDAASQRGCFKASDMSAVGQLYEKLQKLLVNVDNSSDDKSAKKV